MERLRRGDTGPLVEMLQLGLARAGYINTAPDGLFGPRTEAALLRLQLSFELPPTGIADGAIWDILTPYISGAFYRTVRPGETLFGLAAAYGVSVNEILTANPELTAADILPGAVLTVPRAGAEIPANVTYSYTLVSQLIRGLQARFPFLEVGRYGKSACGRTLYLLCAGNGKKELFVCAGLCANEWLNTAVLLRFTEDYLRAVSAHGSIAGTDAAVLLEKTKLYIAPSANPDGLDLATGAEKTGPSFESALRIAQHNASERFPVDWEANARGIDLDLQFPAQWAKCAAAAAGQGFDSPAPHGYPGSAPLIAPEAKALYDLTNEHNFKIALVYGSPGNTICRKHCDYFPPESQRIAYALSEASGYPQDGSDPQAAGYREWFTEQFNRPAYMIKTGSGKTLLSVEKFDAVYAANAPLLTAALRETAEL